MDTARRGRGFRSRRLPARRRGAADRRTRRLRGRGRSSDRRGRGDRRRTWRDELPGEPVGRGAAAVLGRPQGGLSGGRPHLARLLLHGRNHPRKQIGACFNRMKQMEDKYGLRVRQRVPRRRRQSASADPLRRQQAGRIAARRGIRRRHLRLCVEVGGVLTGEHGVGVEKRDLMDTMFNEIDLNQQQRLKCAFDGGPAQSRQSVSAALPLRRARPDARACGQGRAFPICRASEASAVLRLTVGRARIADAVAWADRRGGRWRSSPAAPSAAWPPDEDRHALDVSRLAGIVDYEAAELVLTAKPGDAARPDQGGAGGEAADAGLRAARTGAASSAAAASRRSAA